MTLQHVVIVTLVLAAAVKAWELARDPREGVLSGALVACLGALALGQFLSLPPVTAAVDGAVTVGAGKVVYNAATMVGLWTLLFFFRRAILGAGPARPRVRADGAVLVLTLVGTVALMVATPPPLRGHTLSSPSIGYPTVTGFYLLGNAFFVYAYLCCAALAWRFAVGRGRGTMTVALRFVVLGLLGLTVVAFVRTVWVLIRWAGGPPLAWVNTANFGLNNVAYLLVTVGMVVMGVARVVPAVRARVQQHRRYRELAPLWTLLATIYPELVLGPADGARRGPPGRFGTRQRFYRRVMECRDGLLRLGPRIALVAGGRDVGTATPAELAAYVRAAVALPDEQLPAAHDLSPVRLAVPTGTDVRADADALVAVAQAL